MILRTMKSEAETKHASLIIKKRYLQFMPLFLSLHRFRLHNPNASAYIRNKLVRINQVVESVAGVVCMHAVNVSQPSCSLLLTNSIARFFR